jgi:hypothetical protein
MPENTVSVARPGLFGNPARCSRPYGCPRCPEWDWKEWGDTPEQAANLRCCIDLFRHYVETGLRGEPTRTGRFAFAAEGILGYPTRAKLVQRLPTLRGKHLACWCHLCAAHKDGKPAGTKCPDCAPCHADVLLELANAGNGI